MLFTRPFDTGHWFRLGFCAWLAFLGQGGGSGFSAPNFGGGGGGGPRGGGSGTPGGAPAQDGLEQFWHENWPVVVGVLVAVVVVGLVIWLAVHWVKARFRFVFLDNVARNRSAIKAPWAEYRSEGFSLFLFRLVFGFSLMLLILAALGAAVGVALPDIQARQFGGFAAVGILLAMLLVLIVAVVAGVIGLFLEDFVVPIMYLRRARVIEAWGIFRRELFQDRKGLFVKYWLFRILINIVVGMLATSVTFALCCIPAIPYLGTVILLPLFVFGQNYPLLFLEQFGPKWRVIQDEKQPPTGFGYGPPLGEPSAGSAPA